MTTTFSVLRDAVQSGRSDAIEQAVKDWLQGTVSSDELHDAVAAHTCTTKPDVASTPQAISESGASS